MIQLITGPVKFRAEFTFILGPLCSPRTMSSVPSCCSMFLSDAHLTTYIYWVLLVSLLVQNAILSYPIAKCSQTLTRDKGYSLTETSSNMFQPLDKSLVKAHGYDGICTEDVWNHPAKNCSAPVKIEQNACSTMGCHHLHGAVRVQRGYQVHAGTLQSI